MGKSPRYTDEFKQEAVNQVVVHGYPVLEVSKRLGIANKSLYDCIKKFSKPARQREEEADLRAENARLNPDTPLSEKVEVFRRVKPEVLVDCGVLQSEISAQSLVHVFWINNGAVGIIPCQGVRVNSVSVLGFVGFADHAVTPGWRRFHDDGRANRPVILAIVRIVMWRPGKVGCDDHSQAISQVVFRGQGPEHIDSVVLVSEQRLMQCVVVGVGVISTGEEVSRACDARVKGRHSQLYLTPEVA